MHHYYNSYRPNLDVFNYHQKMIKERHSYKGNRRKQLCLFDSKKFQVQNLPIMIQERFVELLPRLSAHKLSFTSKNLYEKVVKKRGIPIHTCCTAYAQHPKLYCDGSISTEITDISDNLLSYVKLQSLHVMEYDDEFVEKLELVWKKHHTIEITTENGSDGHLMCLHDGIKYAVIRFSMTSSDALFDVIQLMLNAKIAAFHFPSRDNGKGAIRNVIETWLKEYIVKILLQYPGFCTTYMDHRIFHEFC